MSLRFLNSLPSQKSLQSNRPLLSKLSRSVRSNGRPGIALETFGLLRPDPRTALILATLWAIALGSFALASAYPLALLLLLVAGFLELSFNSMSQTLVQLHAPAEKRGRIIGVFSMASLGTRMFSGFSVGILGQMIGIHWSLALSAGLILLLAGALLTRS